MKIPSRHLPAIIALNWAALLSLGAQVSLAEDEVQDRRTDEAALSSQKSAETLIQAELKSARGSEREGLLLFKLAQVQVQSAAMIFRVAHSPESRNQAGQLRVYEKTLERAIATLSEFLRKYERSDDGTEALYLRGTAYRETKQPALASRDFARVVERFPSSSESIPASFALAEIAMEANRFQEASRHLLRVESRPQDPRYPIALYKQAWCQHNLGNVRGALAYSEKLLHLPQLSAKSADRALYENIFHDLPTFYFEGYRRPLPGFAPVDAARYFRRVAQGEVLSGMLVRYAKLLRAHGADRDVAEWKKEILKLKLAGEDQAEILVTTLEYQKNNRLYADMVTTARDLMTIAQESEEQEASFEKARKTLLEAARDLQKDLTKARTPAESLKTSATLASVYDAFIRIAKKGDSRVVAAHLNLGESLFAIRAFDGATLHYRWVVQNGSSYGVSKSQATEASAKAIASRYESLRSRKAVPVELKAVRFPAQDRREIDPLVAEWVEWIDKHVADTGDRLENFSFEANRTLYSQGRISQAVSRLKSFAFQHPSSSVAIPSATLVLDTYIASGLWKDLIELTSTFSAQREWKKTAFGARVAKLSEDANFKYIESLASAGDLSSLSVRIQDYLSRYPKGQYRADVYALAAKVAEKRYEFAAASEYLSGYLALSKVSGKQSEALKKRILHLTWVSGDGARLSKLASNSSFCRDKGLQLECSRYGALSNFLEGGRKASVRSSQQLALNGPKDLRSIWAAHALNSASGLDSKTRRLLVGELAGNWNRLEPWERFSLIDSISRSVPLVFEMERMALSRIRIEKGSEKAIARRMEAVQAFERSVASASSLPFAHLRARALAEVAQGYGELGSELQRIEPSHMLNQVEHERFKRSLAQMALPLERKAQSLRREADQLVMVSKFETSFPMSGGGNELLKARWSNALIERRWPEVSFYMEEAKSKGLLPSRVLSAAVAASLAATGAQAEASMVSVARK